MLDRWYIAGVLVVVFAITLVLRAVPFAILEPLKESAFVRRMAVWMPVGILLILAAATFRSSALAGGVLPAVLAAAITAVVHLTCGRRTLLSVGAGTLTFVLLVNLW